MPRSLLSAQYALGCQPDANLTKSLSSRIDVFQSAEFRFPQSYRFVSFLVRVFAFPQSPLSGPGKNLFELAGEFSSINVYVNVRTVLGVPIIASSKE